MEKDRPMTKDEVNAELKKYKELGYNIPGMTEVSLVGNGIYPVLNKVELDTSEGSQDIRKSRKTGRFEITAQGLQRLKNAAYIVFDRPREGSHSKGETFVTVSGWRFEVTGAINPTSDGKPISLKAHEEEQRLKIEAEIRKDSSKSSLPEDKKRAYIEGRLAETMIRLKKFYRAMAITGAQSRIITKLLGLKSDYSMAELKKPFIILAAIHQIDKETAAKLMIGMDDLYPKAASFGDEEYVEVEETPEAAELLNEYNKAPDEAETPTTGKAGEGPIPFAELSRQAKIDLIKSILEKKNTVVDYPLEQMTGRELLNLYNLHKEP